MTEDDGHFLSRWSRRKAEIARVEQAEDEARKADEHNVDNAPDAPAAEEAPFDLSMLPKIEDITGETDIRLFLNKAVPEDLRNAALRRTWEVTDSIRDYLDPAREYAWDWNTPGANPGSPLETGYQAARLAAQMLSGGTGKQDDTLVVEISPTEETPGELSAAQAGVVAAPQNEKSGPEQPAPPADPLRLSEAKPESFPADSAANAAATEPVQEVAFAEIVAPQHVRRRHGGAAPV